MTAPNLPALLNSTDLASFQASSPDFFLAAVGETVRWDICQWHVYPSISVTETLPIQPDGTIMLPSLYVTEVDSITINGLTQDPSSYTWHQSGYIHRIRHDYFEWPLWPLESDRPFREYPSPLALFADVTYTHGYPTIPAAVNAVALELTSRAMELPAGVATSIEAGPQTISLGALGIVPTEEQRRRLGPYTLVRF